MRQLSFMPMGEYLEAMDEDGAQHIRAKSYHCVNSSDRKKRSLKQSPEKYRVAFLCPILQKVAKKFGDVGETSYLCGVDFYKSKTQ